MHTAPKCRFFSFFYKEREDLRCKDWGAKIKTAYILTWAHQGYNITMFFACCSERHVVLERNSCVQ